MNSRLLNACGRFLFRYRNAAFPMLILLGALIAHPRRPAGSVAADRALDAIGFTIALAGQALRMLTIGFKYIRRGGLKKQVYAEGLVTGGVFAHCRNPMYTGNILMGLGVIVVVGDPLLLAIGAPLLLFLYVAIVAAEEDYLRQRFGEAFTAYTRRVNRWIPNFRGMTESLRDIPFSWRRVLAKEYGTTAGLLASLLVARAWSAWTLDRAIPVGPYAVAALLLAAGYATLRWLKKSRRLVDPYPENVDGAPAVAA